MSSKSHIVCTADAEIYSETNEPQSVFGKFQGFNVYAIISTTSIAGWKLEGDHFLLTFVKNSAVAKEMGIPSMRIWGAAVNCIEWDVEDLMIEFKGGHFITRKLENKDFEYFVHNDPFKKYTGQTIFPSDIKIDQIATSLGVHVDPEEPTK